MNQPLPASQTKHLTNLSHPLTPPNQQINVTLNQISSIPSSDGSSDGSTGTTGTTLWLSSQILSLYLSSVLAASSATSKIESLNAIQKGKKRVFELGGGIGYSTLNILSLGYGVTSTDIEPVLSKVLKPNVENGKRTLKNNGFNIDDNDIQIKGLDWCRIAKLYDDNTQKDGSITKVIPTEFDYLEKGFDIIIMSDTFYSLELIEPLWKTLLFISLSSFDRSPPHDGNTTTNNNTSTGRYPVIYIGLERRDPKLIDTALEHGKRLKFDLKKINKSRLNKEIQSNWNKWNADDWNDIEIWKCRYKP
ncbi:uncharacterized protein L201_001873 [Kwoniella dendrophila CBS 6074]|uniref:Uncharacterized protein n=1 Tax=Kwoniella dendrophila CBS 6074 TaxID=1295534 RepID=A0AAX4JNK8_9TREE